MKPTHKILTIRVAYNEETQEVPGETREYIEEFLRNGRDDGHLAEFQILENEEAVSVPENLGPDESIFSLPTIKEVTAEELRNRRNEIAQEAFEKFVDDSGEKHLENDGWVTEGDWMSRRYYVENPENPDGDSVIRNFEITFQPNSSEIVTQS